LSNTYLLFDFICFTLSFADTHEFAKYARTYIRRYTHTQDTRHKKQKKGGVQKKKKKKKKKGGGGGGNGGKGGGALRRAGPHTKNAKTKRGKRKKRGGEEKEKSNTEGDGFRGVEERRY